MTANPWLPRLCLAGAPRSKARRSESNPWRDSSPAFGTIRSHRYRALRTTALGFPASRLALSDPSGPIGLMRSTQASRARSSSSRSSRESAAPPSASLPDARIQRGTTSNLSLFLKYAPFLLLESSRH